MYISHLKYLLEYYISFQVKRTRKRIRKLVLFIGGLCGVVSQSVVFNPGCRLSFYKHCCFCPSLRDSDLVGWKERAWLLLLFKSSESEKGVWEGVSASCGLGLSATSPIHILSSGLGLLRACQLGH